jgi:hypothetical protein
MFVVFDAECKQDLEKYNGIYEHRSNLICAQQMCAKCQDEDDVGINCQQCGKRSHYFWEDPVGKFVEYLRESRKFADTIYVVSHNSRGYDVQFLLKRFLELKWTPNLVMDGTKIISMKVEHLIFVYSLNCINVPMKRMPKAFDLTCKKGYYPHYFNTDAKLDYEGPYLEPKYYGSDYMSLVERDQFLFGIGSAKAIFSVTEKNCWPTAWMMSRY